MACVIRTCRELQIVCDLKFGLPVRTSGSRNGRRRSMVPG
jgi:hypothetical protein